MLAAAFLDDFSSKWRRREVSTAATNEGGVKGSRSRARWELRFVLATSGFGFSRRRPYKRHTTLCILPSLYHLCHSRLKKPLKNQVAPDVPSPACIWGCSPQTELPGDRVHLIWLVRACCYRDRFVHDLRIIPVAGWCIIHYSSTTVLYN